MAKDYMCKDGKFNNNGWCNKRKIQGLKKIEECEFKNECLGIIDEVKDVKKDSGSYKVFGAREMFYNIQRQMLAIEQQAKVGIVKDKYQALKDTMVSLETKLVIDESVFGIAIDYMIDQDIVNNSKAISKIWGEK